jgi:hypothetical protein
MSEVCEFNPMNINPYFLEGVGDPPVWAPVSPPDYRYLVSRGDESRKRMPTGWVIERTEGATKGAVVWVYNRNIPAYERLTHTLPPGSYNFLSINNSARVRAAFSAAPQAEGASLYQLSFYHGTVPNHARSIIIVRVRDASYPHKSVFSARYAAENAFLLREVPISLAKGYYFVEVEMAPDSSGVPCLALLQVSPKTTDSWALPNARLESLETVLTANAGSAFPAMRFRVFEGGDATPRKGKFPGTPVKFEVLNQSTGTHLAPDPYLTSVMPAPSVDEWGQVVLPKGALLAGPRAGTAELAMSVLLQRYVHVGTWPLQIVPMQSVRRHLTLVSGGEHAAATLRM